MSGKYKFAIDRGGTFTDIYAICPDGREDVLKLLSVDPNNYQDAPREGIRRILQKNLKRPVIEPIDASCIEWIRMGTTVATNALLERKGEKMALIVTKGFRDLLHIGNQARPKIFDLEMIMPDVLYEDVIEVDCRVIPAMQSRCRLNMQGEVVNSSVTKEKFHVMGKLDESDLILKLGILKEKGVNSLAVVLMHSYAYVEDELCVGKIARNVGFEDVSLSHQLMPMIKIVPRGYTVCADAYLTPCIKKYVKSFSSGFRDNLANVKVLFMQSDGGLTQMSSFSGYRAILSGPAGGVVGYAVTTPKTGKAVIGFDMGGTSTDVSRFDGHYEHVFETTIAGISIQAPQLDVNTVAAGGGSRLFFHSGMFVVGPESAGAHPGPVCYGKGGFLTVTDGNLALGRLLPQHFPKIFGPLENQPLDKAETMKQFEILAKKINKFQMAANKPKMSIEEIAMGFIKVANEAMCRPIKALTQAKGHDTRHHILACFGGAGGQHACAISKELGIGTVFIHKYAGILSAYGMARANIVRENQEPCSKIYSQENFDYVDERLNHLKSICADELMNEGFRENELELECFLHLRYDGTDCALMCSSNVDSQWNLKPKHGDFKGEFLKRYKMEFGFTLTDRKIYIDDIRVRASGLLNCQMTSFKEENPVYSPVNRVQSSSVYFDSFGFADTAIFTLPELEPGNIIKGPAIVIDNLCTILVEPNCSAAITPTGDIEISIETKGKSEISEEFDPIQLSIFSHRFMSIAEQMGRVLQRTAISTNIKERLDFSCAVFGPDGGLVSNAPHIPVHLGAMQETVQYQLKSVGNELKRGDVLLSNHPKAGGSHLPDLTVITPVFYEKEESAVFFVASRGHHADIGGISPGSMPPHSKSLSEEGATFESFFLVREGRFCEEQVTRALLAPADIPGCSGTRNLSDNLSDLKAQIASNQKGINLVGELIDSYGLRVVQAYMKHIQNNAECAVRDLLREVGQKMSSNLSLGGMAILSAFDYMDDGSRIQLKISIDPNGGSAVFDFTMPGQPAYHARKRNQNLIFSGTSFEVWGNCNAPKAVTMSALIYCLRCMVGRDVPLNQGCLIPVRTIIPKGSLLHPSDNAAVVGGNVQTSQRIVDVIFKAFACVAASQGCMNNVTFGQQDWGYYETVGGGAGAGPSWSGRSGVHSHMTNTRITDPEILEKRYPVMLREFGLRKGTGGDGKFKGGDGIVRELMFRAEIQLSILTERRVFSPYGLCGGKCGKRGENLLIKEDGRTIRLPSKTSVLMLPGDVFRLSTPGGGGYGEPESVEEPFAKKTKTTFLESGSLHKYKMDQESA